MGSDSEYGYQKEKDVAAKLRRQGYSTRLSPGSRGPSDIFATNGAKRWAIQVKATRSTNPPAVSPEERRRLKIQAQRIKATPVLTRVNRGKVRYFSVRTGQRLRVT